MDGLLTASSWTVECGGCWVFGEEVEGDSVEMGHGGAVERTSWLLERFERGLGLVVGEKGMEGKICSSGRNHEARV